MSHKETVVVAMSGGVDSSVAAALLVEQGYNVIGMMMRLWAEETVTGFSGHNRCCTPDQMADARHIANQLGIPFYVIDTKETFLQNVVHFFIESHRAGVTPNPCMECNRIIRFDWLLKHALLMDADYLATGHYARITTSPDGVRELREGVDPRKDQSYVLSVLSPEKIKHAMFPIGDYTKPEIRAKAAEMGLHVAQKSESQDLCFLGDGDYRRFLQEHAGEIFVEGDIRRRDGEVVGTHTGLPNYTIGQRKGLGIAYSEPLYVVELDTANNTLIVGTQAELGSQTLTAKRVNWVMGSPPDTEFRAGVKIRYKSLAHPATVRVIGEDRVEIIFDEPRRDITPGQGAVMYLDDLVVGGGAIE